MTWQRWSKGRINTGWCLIDSSNRMEVHLPSSPSKLDVNLSPTASLRLEQRSPQQLWNTLVRKHPLVGNGASAKLRSSTGFPARKLVRLSATMSMSLCLSGNWDVCGAIFAASLVAWPMDWGKVWGTESTMLNLVNHNKILHFATFVCNMWLTKHDLLYLLPGSF